MNVYIAMIGCAVGVFLIGALIGAFSASHKHFIDHEDDEVGA